MVKYRGKHASRKKTGVRLNQWRKEHRFSVISAKAAVDRSKAVSSLSRDNLAPIVSLESVLQMAEAQIHESDFRNSLGDEEKPKYYYSLKAARMKELKQMKKRMLRERQAAILKKNLAKKVEDISISNGSVLAMNSSACVQPQGETLLPPSTARRVPPNRTLTRIEASYGEVQDLYPSYN
ncbi:hypothetical protein FO519_009478 [Halicephalobus sp. NKZ332]|nr:hypothetical protein FO519_009478 [Halicephalobus sp. NKZ332]